MSDDEVISRGRGRWLFIETVEGRPGTRAATATGAGGATSMRTRWLPLNERRPQGKKAPAAFEGVVRSPRKKSQKTTNLYKKKGKKRWQSHEILVNFQLQTNLFVFSQLQQKKPSRKKKKITKKVNPKSWLVEKKSIVTNQATKIGRKLCSGLEEAQSVEWRAPGQSTHINNFFPAQFFSIVCFRFPHTEFSHMAEAFWSAIKPNEIVLA